MVSASTGNISTLVGSLVDEGNSGPNVLATLNWPGGLEIAPVPGLYSVIKVYFADSGNNEVREVTSSRTSPPAFSPISATYSSPQTVAISDAIAGATVHYTTDGSTPTASSPVYSGPIAIGASATLNAVAVTSDGLLTGASAAPYTITQATPTVNFSAGFDSGSMSLVNGAVIQNGVLQLTDGNGTEQRAAWFSTPLSAQAFVTDFDYQISAPVADGIGFVLQNTTNGIYAVGSDGDELGFGGLNPSVAIKFDFYNNSAEGMDSTGVYINGVTPTIPASDMTASGLLLRSGDPMHVHVTYDGTTLTWTITDKTTNATFTSSSAINIPSILGSNTAYIGFTGATGTFMSSQTVSGWTHTSGSAATYTAAPVFSPAGGTYAAAQTVSITDTTPGATIYYTTDGSTPTTSSVVYTGPINVATTETLKAVAVATGFYNSAVSSASYTIGAISVSITPATGSLNAGQTLQFSASVSGTADHSVTWAINPAGIGTISSGGLYTAPSSISSQQSVTIIATSQADTSSFASATVSLTPSAQCTTSGYNLSRTIVIDHTRVPNSDQVNFPFLFSSTDPSFASVANGGQVTNPQGYDIIFSTDPNGATKLDHELEEYNALTGQVIAWVRIPTLSHTTDTTIYMFYGNSSISTPQQNPSGVWDANYRGVWHVANAGAVSLADSTSNGNNAINNGTMATGGEIDGAMLTGGTGYANLGTPASLANLALGSATFSAWVNPSSGNDIIMGKDDHDIDQGWSLSLDADNNVDFSVIHSNTDLSLRTSTPLTSGAWSYVTVTLVGTPASSQATIYVNGVMSTSAIGGAGDTLDDSAQTAFLANANYGDHATHVFNGSIDEFRISQSIRSADWIATEYNNQSSPATFYSVRSGPFTISPNPVTLYASQTQQFSAIAVNSCVGSATWSISPSDLGTISATGLYTAPQNITAPQTVTVTAASTTSETSSATITLYPPIAVSISPAAVTLSNGGQQQQFTANVRNTENNAVTWTINPAGVGTIDAAGLYSAPNGISGSQTVTVTGTSQADSTRSATATITLNPPVLPPPICTSSGYSFTRAIVIDHTKVANSDQSNFPFLFNSTDPVLATTANGGHVANVNGYDIIFSTDPAGHDVLSYEMEKYNPITGQVIAWVNIPTLSHTVDTVIYMFYGNNSINASQQNPAGVWDSSYLGVWHLPNGTRLSLADSSIYRNDASDNGATAAPGQIDGGMQTDGSTYATIGAPASLSNLPSGNATFSAWVQVTAAGSGVIMGKEAPYGQSSGWELDVEPDNRVYFEGIYSANWISLFSTGKVNPGQWAYLTVTLAGTPDNGGQATIYINGVASGTGTGSGQPNDDSAQTAYLANVGWDWPFEGSTDEFRISRVVRSADWIATEYNSQAAPFLFYQLSGENAVIVPSSATLYAGQSKQFIALTGCGSLPSVSWSIPSNSLGTLSATGLYTAPPSIDTQQTVSVTATSTIDGSTVGSALVTLFPPLQVTVAPAITTLYGASETRQFTANVTNATNTSVVWSISPAGIGSISDSGLYTAPSSSSGAQTVTVIATSLVDPTQSGSATISITPLVISPSLSSILGGFTQQFTANMPVSWRATEGTIDSTGLYTAPVQLTGSSIATIVATSLADPNASVSLSLKVSPSLQLFPATTSLYGGQTLQFDNCGAVSQNSWTCPLPSVWSIIPVGAGSIDSNGLYTALIAIPTQQTITVIATAASNPLQQGSATISLTPPTASIVPRSSTLYSGQSEQFFATIRNSTVTDVVWSLSPAGLGFISSSGLYQAPNGIVTPQVVTVIASSKAVPSISASASVTLSPAQCLSKSYSHVRSITIDHNKVPNTDQLNFPFLFTATDTTLATTSNGGHVANPSGYDIVFTSDPAGVNRLDYEIEQYNPVSGQITAWIKVPNISHSSDTVIYMFYGNAAISSSQQNPGGVWQNNFGGVYHLAEAPSTSPADSTGNQNNGEAKGLLNAPGVFDSAIAFDGATSYISLPAAGFGNYPANGVHTTDYSTSLATWFKTSQEGVVFAQTSGPLTPGTLVGGYIPALYIDNAGLLRASLFNLVDAQQGVFFGTRTIDYVGAPQIVSTAPYNDNQWHFAAVTYADGTETLYVDGEPVAAQFAALQSGYSSSYSYFAGTGYTWQWAGAKGSWDYFKGSLEEVEISDVARSGDWIRTEYLNQSSPATFSTLSAELSGNVSISPLAPVLYGGQNQQFTILDPALCGAGGASWSMPEGSPGTLSVSGLYTAPPTIRSQQTVVISATTLGSNSAPVAATVTLMPAVSITVTPASATLASGESQQFTANVANTTNAAVVWAISPSTAGSITPNGFYLAPQSIQHSQTVTVTATSLANANQFASATITLIPTVTPPAVSVTVSPASVTLGGGQIQQFTAAINNSSNTAVTWSMQPSGAGTLSSSGLYTAPTAIAAQQSVTITATSQADPSKSASAIVTLSPTACASLGFAYQRAVVIDHTKIPNSDLYNFPLLFNTIDPAFANVSNGGHVANPNGYDIIFSADPDGRTRLDHELESYNPTTGQVVAWIRIPQISHISDTTLYMFYGNPSISAPQANATGVWDDNYLGVWHLASGSLLSADDSTANANNGSNNGVGATAGLIDGAGRFNGSSSYIDVGSLGALPTEGTISFWMNSNPLSSYPNAFTTSYNGSNNAIRFEEDSNGDFAAVIGNSDSTFNGYGYMQGAMSANTWYNVVLAWNTSASVVTGYLNGQQVFSGTNTLWPASISDLAIGVGWSTDRVWKGVLDEVRLSDSTRSPSWIAAEFSNQNSPSTFYALQTETAFGVVPQTITLYASQNQQFSVVQPGSCGTSAVNWSISDGGPGSLSPTGLYTAPAAVTNQQFVTITAASQTNSNLSASATVTLMPPVSVSITPSTVTLSENQSEQFTALVANSLNSQVTWSVSPAGMGTIDPFGAYIAPAGIASSEEATITAESVEDPTKFASAAVTVTPTVCASAVYGYQRVIVIDHTKVGNADLSNFPLLFNTTDRDLASVDNGGHIANSSGYDILFSSDPNGTTKLDYELEKYNPATGQVIAWIRIPTLSHTTDTVLYVFYGNPNITSTQQNPAGVWASNYLGVYHFANGGLQDSTKNVNNAIPTLISTTNGIMAAGAGLNGNSGYFQLPAADFPNYPTGVYDNIANPAYTPPKSFSSSFAVWFKTGFPGGLLGQVPSISTSCIFYLICSTDPTLPGYFDPYGWNPMLYVDDNGKLVGGSVTSPNSYDDNNWHYAVVTYSLDGTDTLYVDGQSVGTAVNQFPTGYSPAYNYFVGTSYTFLANDGNWDWLYLNGTVDEVKVTNTPLSSAWVQTEFNNQNSPSTFYKFYARSSTSVAPSSVSLYATESQQFAVPGLCNSAVSWSLPSGAPGTINSSGLYTAPSSVASQQTIAITATSIANGGGLGGAAVTLLPAPVPITLTATTQPPYQVGSTQSFSATVLDADGTPATGVTVAFATTGSNAGFASVTTDDNGVATYSYLGANSGTDNLQATVSLNGELLTSNSINVVWLAPITANPAAAVKLLAPPSLGVAGLVGAFTDSAGNVIEPIAVGAKARSFPVPAGATQLQLGINSQYYPQNGGAGFTVLVNGAAIAVPPTAMPWTWVLGGRNTWFQYGIYNPAIQNGVLDGTPPVVAAQNLAPGSVLTIAYQNGTASINLPVRPLVDADGDQTWTPGTEIWHGATFPTQYTTTKAYSVGLPITFDAQVLDAAGAPMANVPVTLTISGANPQSLQGTTDSTGEAAFLYTGVYAGTDNIVAQANPSGEGVLTSGLDTVTWVTRPAPSQPGSLSIAYFAGVNIGQVYNVLAKDSSGSPIQNANLGYYVWGVDNYSQAGTTDVTGHGSFGYNHDKAGTYNLVAVETQNGNTIFSNVISGVWTPPSSTGTCYNCSDSINVSISAPNSVTLPASLALTGTVTDSVGIIPTVSWTQISGPGTVTFSAPDQAVTTASFSEPGVYVVQLYATDTGASASVQFTVTVRQAQAAGVPQGWIGSPLYGASVSGIVPITLAPGVSLQSGTLTYFPATDTSNVTVLNANTTGSGQIGALDTTQLLNGSYWIQLHGVDSNGDSQYSLILVTATGDYKPGRITTTVTDLVVPSTGLAINIQRTYDSLNAAMSSDFGFGWSLGINVNLAVSPAGDVTFTLGGLRKTFYLAPQMPPCAPLIGCLFPYYFVDYRPEPGLQGTLTTSDLACPLNIVALNGNRWQCQDGAPFSPSGYVYTDPVGTAYTISATGNLQSIVDKNGNALSITPGGIISSTGLSVPFVRDSSGRITQITDPQGNIYQYSYDDNGDLSTVTYPNTPQPSTYTYNSNHFYLSGTDFRGNPLPSTGYYQSAVSSGGLCTGDCDPNGLPLNGRVKSSTDAMGATTSYSYDLVARSTTITYPPDAAGNIGTATMVVDQLGDLLTWTDPVGHTTTNVYDSRRNLISVTDPLGHTTTYAYDQNGNRTSVTYPKTASSKNTTSTTIFNQFSEPISATDELGNVRAFHYDAGYNPLNVTDSLGTIASFQFDANGILRAGAVGYDLTAQPAKASQYTYDAYGNLASTTDALGRTTWYTYNSIGQKLSMTTPLPGSNVGGPASTTTYQYDPLGNLTKTTAPLGDVTSSQFDGNGNRISSTDPLGNVTTYQYDALNRLTTVTYPTQPATTTTKTYDFRNNIVDSTDQNGSVTHNTYDLAGRLISETRAYGTAVAATTSYAYYDDGRKKSETDPLGHMTTYTYDEAGRLTTVSNAAGDTHYAYDDAGNQVSMTDPKGYITQYQYNARKQLVKTIFPDNTTASASYDGPGNVVSTTDQAGSVVQSDYDAANQLSTVIQLSHPDSSHNSIGYSYDSLGNQTGMTDENGHTTQSRFDVLSRLVSRTLPDGSLTEGRQYDAAGNLTSLTHFNGKTTTYTYDNLNRLTARIPDPTTGEHTVSFTYTATGKRHSMTDASGTTNYTYDNLDRLITKVTPEGTLNYTYDAASNIASIVSSNPNGASVSYTYDDVGRLSTVVDNRLGTTTYTYDASSNVATAAYPNGTQTTFQYDKLNRLTGLVTPQINAYTYILGPTGNRSSALEQNNRFVQWNYDGVYRLTNESITNAPAGKNGSIGYGLDPVGDRQTAVSSIPGLNPVAGTFNQDDELVSSESYDSNGNVTASGGKTFTYDSENRLVSMNGGAVSFLYDGDGNRVAKSVNGVVTRYLVDDLNPTGLPQVVEELSGAGAVQRVYSYGLQRISQDQIVSSTWTPSFFGYDGFGTVRQLTNSAGAITDTYDFDAFGNKIYSSGSIPNNYLYRGEQYDSDLGFYFLRARYYNPTNGRFLSVDPFTGKGQRRYAYAEANPVDKMDPTGQAAIVEFLLLNFSASHPVPFPTWCKALSASPMSAFLPGCGNGSGAGGGQRGDDPNHLPKQPLPPPSAPDIRLVPVTDTTVDTGIADRDIDYKIKNIDGTPYTGTPLWVNELILPLHGSPKPRGTEPVGAGYYSSASPRSRPNDWFDGLGIGLGNVSFDYTQSFIVSTAPGLYPAASETILVRYGGNDYSTISLHLGSNHVVLTNGLTVYPGTVP